ncbi:YVTN family beta-propeller repeat protein [Mycolicibacterium psychrotolerans]|uniref:YNCE-like beta-propeller domain-containing protein n=1 Tax=Mycolicibacterium psychrotolerans TaxID=216929 RepID=A0A7I7MG43_9MYCO|nr:beta-propeller fold lactonase family protein [Mycolicibacterium psychrotolerans]BBX70329.1 hypothetical protein MPSYJ_37900 [Mycolicibacterium psychrotolerans]
MAAAPQDSKQTALTWQLVEAAPGALFYSAAVSDAPTHHPRQQAWLPEGSSEGLAREHPEEPAHHRALAYAVDISRAGLLAAALGIGAAVARAPGVAWAEPTQPDSASSTESASSTSATTETGTPASTSRTDSESDTGSESGTDGPSTAESSADEGPASAAFPDSPELAAGARASTSSDAATAVEDGAGDAQTADPGDATAPAEEESDQQLAAPAGEQQDTAAGHAVEDTTGETPAGTAASLREADEAPEPVDTEQIRPVAPPMRATDTAAPTMSQAEDVVAPQDAGPTGVPARPDGATPDIGTEQLPPTPPDQLGPASTPAPLAPMSITESEPVPAHATPPADVATTLLSTLGLTTLGGTSSPVPVEPPATWALLDWARRQKDQPSGEQISSGAAPASTGQLEDVPEPTGSAIRGGLMLVNPGAVPLAYHVTGGPAHGTVTIEPDGTFVYTPSAAGDSAVTLQDNFTVTVSDATGNSTTVPITLITDPAGTASALSLRANDPGGTDALHVSIAPGDIGSEQGGLLVRNPSYGTTATSTTATSTTVYEPVAPDAANPTTQSENTVVATVGVGRTPTRIAVSPDGTRAYVTNTSSRSVSVIDTATNTVIDTVRVGHRPTAVRVSPDGTRAYVTNTYSRSVSVIDTATNTVIDTVRVGLRPTALAVSPDGTRAYVINSYSRSVSVIDTATNTVTDTVCVGKFPTRVAVSPDGSRAYVTNSHSRSVSVIDTDTDAVIDTVRVGRLPNHVAVSPDGTRAYVTNTYSRSVSVIDTDTNTVIDTVRVGWAPTAVTVSPDGTRAYLSNTYSRSVSVIDTATNTVIDTVRVGWAPTAVAISPDGTRTYVTNSYSGSVSVIDTATNTVIDTVGVGRGPVAVAVTAGGSLPIVTPPSPPVISDPTTGAMTGFLGVFDPDGDPLTFTLAPGGAPNYGTVTIDATGNYTHMPNGAAQIRVGLGVPIQDSFTVNVTQPSAGGNGQVYVVNANSNSVSVIGAEPTPVSRTLAAATAATAAPAALAAEDGFSTQVTIENIQIGPAELVPATIPGLNDTFDVAVSAGGTRAYFTKPGESTVWVVNTADNTVTVDPISVGLYPTAVAASSDGTRVYVTNYGDDTLSVINTEPNTPGYNEVIGDPIPGIGDAAVAVAISPDGTRAYVTHYGDVPLSVVDIDPDSETYGTVTTIEGTTGSFGVAVSPDNNWVYVATNPVLVIDTNADSETYNKVVDTVGIGTGNMGWGAAVTPDSNHVYPDGSRVYVTGFDTVLAIDTDPASATYNQVVGTIFTPMSVSGHGVAFSLPDGSLAYVANSNTNNVSVIDTDPGSPTYNQVIATVDGGGAHVAVTPDGHRIYGAGSQSTVISVVPITS